MYMKIQLTGLYKNEVTFVGISLTNNHHIRAIVMIHRSTSRCQHILYPTKGIETDLLMDPLVYVKKVHLKIMTPLYP